MISLACIPSFLLKRESSIQTTANDWIPDLRCAASGMTRRKRGPLALTPFISINWQFELFKQIEASWLIHRVTEHQAQKHPSFRRKPESSEASQIYAWIINLGCAAPEMSVEVAR